MKDGVPKNSPAVVRVEAGSLAMPKSMTLGWPDEAISMMFAGLMSRWTIPFACAWWRASASFSVMRRAWRQSIGVPSEVASARVWPSRYSRAM